MSTQKNKQYLLLENFLTINLVGKYLEQFSIKQGEYLMELLPTKKRLELILKMQKLIITWLLGCKKLIISKMQKQAIEKLFF